MRRNNGSKVTFRLEKKSKSDLSLTYQSEELYSLNLPL